MAQLSDSLKSTSFQTPSSTYKSSQAEVPKVEELLPGDSAIYQSAVTSGKHNDYDSVKKASVLNKFRDKAKKLKSTLSSKRIRQSNTDSEYDRETENKNENDNEDEPDDKTSRSMEVNLDEDEVDEDPEYLGAPIYESVQAPQECKEHVKQHPREVTASAEKHIIESCAKNAARKDSQEPTIKTMTESVSEKLVPAYNAVSSATQAITSKISSLTVETLASTNNASNSDSNSSGVASSASGGQIRNSSLHMYDKGVSVKAYLMQKLKPGEDEKALSQVITDAIANPNGYEQVAMVGKMKEAVTSYLQPSSDSATESSGKTNVSMHQNSLSNKASNVSTDQNSSSNKASKVSTDQNSSSDKASNISTDQNSSSNKASNISTAKNSSSNKVFTASKTFTTRHDPAHKASVQNAIAADTKSYSLPNSSSDPKEMKSKSCNATSNYKLSSFIPISTNSEEDTNAENRGKILQTN